MRRELHASLLVLAPLLTLAGSASALTLDRIDADLGTPVALAGGDVDGDGVADLVAGREEGPPRLYLGRDGGFEPAGEIGDHSGPVALADLDGDGDLDLIVAPAGDVAYLHRNEAGELAPEGEALTPDITTARALAAADFDGDGASDLVVASEGAATRLYFARDGAFGRAASLTLGNDGETAQALAIGDLDGDGDPDLVIGHRGAPVRVHLNGGTSFTSTGIGAAADVRALTLADLDGDGDLDLAVAVAGGVNRIHLNDGSGTFDGGTDLGSDAADSRGVVAADFDGDGDPDLLLGNAAAPDRLHFNRGGHQGGAPGQFDDGAATVIDGGDGTGLLRLAAGEDGAQLAAFGPGAALQRLVVEGAGLFGAALAGGAARSFGIEADDSLSGALADLDGDGRLDLVVGNATAPNRIYLNQGSGLFAVSDFGTPGVATHAVALADLDGDGDIDIVTGNWEAPNRLYLNNGDGTFDSGSDIGTDGHATTGLALADLDGDGRPDLAVANHGQVNRYHLNLGGGLFDGGHDLTGDLHRSRAILAGDLDGDGRTDLLAVNSGRGERNRFYLNKLEGGAIVWRDRQGLAGGGELPDLDDQTQAGALADFDGDGDLDFVAANSGVSRLYLNDGTALFGDGEGGGIGIDLNPGAPHAATSVAVGDVDGDGDPDLVIGGDRIDRLYLNQGGRQGGVAGRFEGAPAHGDPLPSYLVDLADLDGDGLRDLVTVVYGEPNRYHPNRLATLVARVAPSPSARVVVESASPVTLAVGCLGTVTGAASVDYRIEFPEGGADAQDLNTASGTLNWSAGPCEAATFELDVPDDGIGEGNEPFELVLENPVGVVLGGDLPGSRRYRFEVADPAVTAAPETEPAAEATTSLTTTVDTTAGALGPWSLLLAPWWWLRRRRAR